MASQPLALQVQSQLCSWTFLSSSERWLPLKTDLLEGFFSVMHCGVECNTSQSKCRVRKISLALLYRRLTDNTWEHFSYELVSDSSNCDNRVGSKSECDKVNVRKCWGMWFNRWSKSLSWTDWTVGGSKYFVYWEWIPSLLSFSQWEHLLSFLQSVCVFTRILPHFQPPD